MSRVTNLFRWGNVLLVFITLLSYLSPFISPAKFWPPAFLGLIYPWLLLANLFFILFWAVQRKWYALLSLGCLLLGWNHLVSIIGFNSSVPMPEDEAVIRVMSFNARGFRDVRNGDEYLSVNELTDLLVGEDPDIIFFQEFPPYHKKVLKYVKFLTAHSDLKHYYKEKGGLVIFSRFPLKNTFSRFFENHANGYQRAEIEVNGRHLQLFNVHLQSNSLTKLADRVIERGDFQKKETWRNVRGMMKLYRASARLRAEQSQEIRREIGTSKYPVILGGDFNDVPQSYVYRQLSNNLKDAFKERGSGLGITYAGKIPALRIDYIFASPGLQVLHYETGPMSFSDHRPVRATLSLSGPR